MLAPIRLDRRTCPTIATLAGVFSNECQTTYVPYTRGAVAIAGLGVSLLALAVVLLATAFLLIAMRRAGPLMKARTQAIAVLCARRGLVPGAAAGDFALLGPIDPHWLTNKFSSPDRGLAVADFIRPAGKQTQFFSVLTFTISGLVMPYVAVTRRNLIGITVGGPPPVELESTEFGERFTIRAGDRRSAVMLLDQGMMQLLLDCGDVSFDMVGDEVLAFINRAAEPAHQPAEPVEFELLFKFRDGFVQRLPDLLRVEYAAPS